MCRLFGLIANQPVDIAFSFSKGDVPFSSLGRRNPDGWGIGWYQDGRPQVRKEPVSAAGSREASRVAQSVRSRVFMSHVRHATTGEPLVENCHPFVSGGWLFAHNGCIDRDALCSVLDEPHQMALEGDTDSAAYFQWILQNITEQADVESGIAAALHRVRRLDHTGLNFLLTDGESLHAYREAAQSIAYYSLYYLARHSQPAGPTSYRSHELRTLHESKALNGEEAVLVCSERLTNENWVEIRPGELVTIGRELAVKVREVR
jgi:predicted glutamine amidotransferase